MTKDIPKILKQKSLLDFIQSHSNLTPIKTGKHYSCSCPFHDEKDASFYIDIEKNTWTCYGSCSANGDIIDFVSKLKNFTFQETLEYLCDIYDIEYANKKKHRTKNEKERIIEICEFTANFYNSFLENSNLNGFSYLNQRKQNFSILKEFNIGYAPSSTEAGWNNLTTALKNNNFDLDLAAKIGLIKKGPYGDIIDIFIDRIIFPVHSPQGSVIGFNSRSVSNKNSAKYMLSSESLVFSRNKVYYGLNKTRKFINQTGICVIVEGIFDFFRLYENGIKNCIPLLGGNLSKELLDNIDGINNYYLMMDFDKAGIKYNSKIGSFLLENSKTVRICSNKKDPDDLTKNEIIKSIRTSVDFIDWYCFKKYKYKDNIEHKLNVMNDIQKIIKNLNDERILLYAKKVSKLLDLPFSVVVANFSGENIDLRKLLNELK